MCIILMGLCVHKLYNLQSITLISVILISHLVNSVFFFVYSVFLDPETRKAMGEQAVALAKAVDYVTAGKAH